MKIILALLMLVVGQASAQSAGQSVVLGGYLEYLISRSTVPATGSFTDHMIQGRLNSKWYAGDQFTTACELRGRIYSGGSVEQTPHFIDLIRNGHEFAHLDASLSIANSTVAYAEIDRLWADWNNGPAQITVGRQRVAMGTNLVWNPTDLFNPLSILDFSYDERPAFDGAHVQYFFGPLSKVEVVVMPGKSSSTAIVAAGFTTNVGEYDLHFLLARRSGRWVLGQSWAGNIAGGGFRGEALVSQNPGEPAYGGCDAAHPSGAMVSASVSGDYTFTSSLYLHIESLYNSAGVTQRAGLFNQQAIALGLLSPARWSLFGEISYDITPLIRGSVCALHNPADGSSVLFPSIKWSVITDLDLSLIALVFHGDPFTEFGEYGESAYLRLRLSF